MHKNRIAEHRAEHWYSAGAKPIQFRDCGGRTDMNYFNREESCHEDECFIMAYVDGELDEDGRRAIEAFLDGNPKAREVADDFRSVTMLLREAFLEPIDCSPSRQQEPKPAEAGLPDAVPNRSRQTF